VRANPARFIRWVVITKNDTSSGVVFQLAPDHKPPIWPDPDHPKQLHFDHHLSRFVVA